MPFESKAQTRKFGAMAGRGEISRAKFREWINKTKKAGGFSRLPERKKKKKKKTARDKYRKMISK